MRTCVIIIAALSLMVCAGCRDEQAGEASADDTDPATAFTLTSSAFVEGQAIPKKHAQEPEGENVSPALAWTNAPDGTVSFAMIVDDPDAPSARNPRPEGPWVHWVVPVIASTDASLAEGYGNGDVPDQGTNDSGSVGYAGPLPPKGSGVHRYVFTLYALDATLNVGPGATKADVVTAINGHVLATAVLTGTYQR